MSPCRRHRQHSRQSTRSSHHRRSRPSAAYARWSRSIQTGLWTCSSAAARSSNAWSSPGSPVSAAHRPRIPSHRRLPPALARPPPALARQRERPALRRGRPGRPQERLALRRRPSAPLRPTLPRLRHLPTPPKPPPLPPTLPPSLTSMRLLPAWDDAVGEETSRRSVRSSPTCLRFSRGSETVYTYTLFEAKH